MHFTTTSLFALLVSAASAIPLNSTPYDNPDNNIFPDFNRYSDWEICKGKITKDRFPNRVVTEQHFFKDGFKTACDCAAKCLEEPNKCTNWVWKHTFMPEDDSKRSCTLYSSPNLPTDVTLKYDLANSKGFNLLQAANNRQAGAPAPLTFLDAAGTIPDKFGVSGFMVQDQNGRQFC
ncbi:hypothetical protein ACKAV7_011994 [Fusarium commune]